LFISYNVQRGAAVVVVVVVVGTPVVVVVVTGGNNVVVVVVTGGIPVVVVVVIGAIVVVVVVVVGTGVVVVVVVYVVIGMSRTELQSLVDVTRTSVVPSGITFDPYPSNNSSLVTSDSNAELYPSTSEYRLKGPSLIPMFVIVIFPVILLYYEHVPTP
jgi:hypothetical protein